MYKRQAPITIKEINMGIMRPGTITPVSYTHLDVYKRQHKLFTVEPRLYELNGIGSGRVIKHMGPEDE